MSSSFSQEDVRSIAISVDHRARERNGKWSVRCPAHNDKNPSCCISLGEYRNLVVKCFAGCSHNDVIDSISRLTGISTNVLFGLQDQTKKREWIYTDSDGVPVCGVARSEDEDGKKTYKQFHYGEDGKVIWRRKEGVLPLYKIDVIESCTRIVVVEGEKCVDALNMIGIEATTSCGGSTSAYRSDWSCLKGKHVVLWPDADEPGKKYMGDVFEILKDKVASLSVVDVSGDDKSSDVADIIGSMSSIDLAVEEVKRRIESAEKYIVHKDNNNNGGVITLAEFLQRYGESESRWLVDEWIPDGTIAFLLSPPQCFKTFSSLDLAISVASGIPFLGNYAVNDVGPVIVYQQEDNFASIAERFTLIMMGKYGSTSVSIDDDTFDMPNVDLMKSCMDNIHVQHSRDLRFDRKGSFDTFEETIKRIRPKMVIIDPLYSVVGTDDYMVKAAEQMMRLKKMRDEYKTSFLVVHHTGKNLDSWDRERAWGSQFINAFIETSWLFRKNANGSCPIVKRHFKTGGPRPLVKLDFDIHSESMPWRYAVKADVVTDKEAENLISGGSVELNEPKQKPYQGRRGQFCLEI